MSELDTHTDPNRMGIYEFAESQLKAGRSAHDLQLQLMTRGLDAEAAAEVIRDVQPLCKNVFRRKGIKRAIIGDLICLTGIATSFSIYNSTNGGVKIILWGPLLFGGLLVLNGLWIIWRDIRHRRAIVPGQPQP